MEQFIFCGIDDCKCELIRSRLPLKLHWRSNEPTVHTHGSTIGGLGQWTA